MLPLLVALAFANGANDNSKGVATLIGGGLLTKQGNSRVIGSIVLAWITTLPVAAVIGALCWIIFNS